jgi:hypothetical protein
VGVEGQEPGDPGGGPSDEVPTPQGADDLNPFERGPEITERR